MRSDVVFPAPLGPSSPSTSPRAHVRSTWSTTTRPPSDFVRPRASRRSSVVDGPEAIERVYPDSGFAPIPAPDPWRTQRVRRKHGRHEQREPEEQVVLRDGARLLLVA